MDTPQLLTEWNELELEAQRGKWREIASLSEQISISAQAADWESLLPLAVKRQALIDDFFAEPICLPLFHTISEQMGAMQQQHEVVARLVTVAIENNESTNTNLQHTRDSLATLARQH